MVLSEVANSDAVAKLEALQIQSAREEKEKREKYLIHMIQYLESKFSKNGGQPLDIDIYGLYDWVERDLFGQYEFFSTKPNFYHVKRV